MDRRVSAGGRSTGSVIHLVPLVNSICSWFSAELSTSFQVSAHLLLRWIVTPWPKHGQALFDWADQNISFTLIVGPSHVHMISISGDPSDSYTTLRPSCVRTIHSSALPLNKVCIHGMALLSDIRHRSSHLQLLHAAAVRPTCVSIFTISAYPQIRHAITDRPSCVHPLYISAQYEVDREPKSGRNKFTCFAIRLIL
jgi:hypothetical protein